VSMMPPTGGTRPGAPPPPDPSRPADPYETELKKKEEERAAAEEARRRQAARSGRVALGLFLLALLLVAGAAIWWLTPKGDTRPIPSWERRVAAGTKIVGPTVAVSPNGKWFALAWSEGSRVWWLRGSSEAGGRLRLDEPAVVSDTTHPFAAFDEDPPKAAVDNTGQVAIAWMARPLSRDAGAVIAVARPDLLHDGQLDVTRIEGQDAQEFLLCESIAYDDDGGLVAVWMDGGRAQDSEGETGTVQCAVASPQGGFEAPITLADSSCSCCRTSLAWLGPEQFALAYRGVAPGNERNVRFGVLNDEGSGNSKGPALIAETRATVRHDGWVLTGCPSEGPSVAPLGSGAAYVSWYTEGNPAGGQPRGLYLARLEPRFGAEGRHWESVQTSVVDARAEAKHPSVTTLSSGRPFVVFDGPTPEGGRALFARVERAGKLQPPVRFTTANSAARGAPVRWGRNGVLIAWQESDEFGPRITLVEWKGL